jgi:ankyrin repeat protein
MMKKKVNSEIFKMVMDRAEAQLYCWLNSGNMNLNIRDNSGDTLLHMAASHNAPEICRMLLEHNANPNAQNYAKMSPLHIAGPNVVRMLVEAGADVNKPEHLCNTPLHYFISSRYPVKIIDYMLQRGANPSAIDLYGKTPLHIAAKFGDYEIVEILLDYGASPTHMDENGWTPITIAQKMENYHLISMLDKSLNPFV